MIQLRPTIGAAVLVFLSGVCGRGAHPATVSTEGTAVTPVAKIVAEGWEASKGGDGSRTWWNTLFHLGLDLDGGAFGAPEQARLVVELHAVANRHRDLAFGSAVGAFHPVSGIMANNHVRLFNVYYRHDSPQGWAFKIGQIAVDDDFMVSSYGGLFMNSAFGAMPSQTATPLSGTSKYGVAYAIYPVAAPGVWASWDASDALSVQAGVYHGGPGPDDDDNTGFRYASLSESGVAVFAEANVRHSLAARSASARLGFASHTGKFDDMKAVNRGSAQTEERGLTSLYVVEDVVLAGTAEEPRLGAFARVGVSPQRRRSVVTEYVDAGFNWFGPLRSRSADVLGVALSKTRFGRDYREAYGLAATETALELTYSIHVAKRLSIQADAQWLFNAAHGASTGGRRTARVFGVRTTLEY